MSPGTRTYDLVEKAATCRDGGITEYWVIDCERRDVVVHRAGQSEYRVAAQQTGRLESSSVAGFWIDVEWLRTEPLPSAPACLRQILGR